MLIKFLLSISTSGLQNNTCSKHIQDRKLVKKEDEFKYQLTEKIRIPITDFTDRTKRWRHLIY